MKYEVEVKKSVQKSFNKLPIKIKKSVGRKLLQLKKFPEISGMRKLSKPLNGYRLRIGNYRVLFTVNSENQLITIYSIDHRKAVYKKSKH